LDGRKKVAHSPGKAIIPSAKKFASDKPKKKTPSKEGGELKKRPQHRAWERKKKKKNHKYPVGRGPRPKYLGIDTGETTGFQKYPLDVPLKNTD